MFAWSLVGLLGNDASRPLGARRTAWVSRRGMQQPLDERVFTPVADAPDCSVGRDGKGLRQVGIRVGDEELSGCIGVDELLIQQPLDGSTCCARVAEGVPRRHEIWVFLVQLVLEPPEGSLASDCPAQPPAGTVVTDSFGEVDHVRVPHPRRKRIDWDEIHLVQVDGVLPVDAGVGSPERDPTSPWVNQPPVVVVGLIRQRGGDLVHVKAAELQHPFRIERHALTCAGEASRPTPRLRDPRPFEAGWCTPSAAEEGVLPWLSRYLDGMREVAGQMSRKDWVAVGGGLLVAFLLVSQLFYTLAWGSGLGTSPGLFVLGIAVLVMVAGIVFDQGGRHRYLKWIVRGLSVTALLLIVGGLLRLG